MYSLDFLCWVNRCLFRDDFMRELQDLGVRFSLAFALSSSEKLDVLSIYQEYINDDDAKQAIETYLQSKLKQYKGD